MAGFSSYRVFRDVVSEVSAGDVGPDTSYPIGLDYETVFKWYYRIKKWTVSMDIVGEASSNGPDSSATASLTSPAVGTMQLTGFTDESYFSVRLPNFQGGSSEQNDSDIDIGFESTSEAYANFINAGFGPTTQFFFTPGAIVKVGSLYYPKIKCDFYLNMAASVEYEGVAGESKTIYMDRPDQLPNSMSFDWEIDGESFTKNGSYETESFPGGGTASVTAEINKITITPEEWWPYNPGTGGPIYDADDGSELRSPFSVQSW